MKYLNEVTLIGNLGADPEVQTVGQDERQLTKLRVATTRTYKDKEYTTWHTVVAWGDNIANFASQYLSKGSYVYIRGRMNYRQWEDDEGNTRNFAEVVAYEVSGLGRSNGREERQTPARPYEQTTEAEKALDLVPANDPDLPF